MGTLLVSVEGTELAGHDRARLSSSLISGVVLFARNYQSKEQLQILTSDIKSCNPNLRILVDQEGGRVQRFVDDFTLIPPASAWGQLYDLDHDNAIRKMSSAVRTLFSELQSCGVEISLVPCLDTDYGRNVVIKDRGFSSDKKVITALGESYLDCMHEMGAPSVGKHFPGHGYVTLDSHVDSPVDCRDWDTIKSSDAEPFIRLLSQLDMIMPAHIIFSRIDSQPVTFSQRWLNSILREELGYTGVVISDCLSMQAAEAVYTDPVDRVNAAIAAGCDWVTFCNSDALIDQLIARQSELLKPSADSLARVSHMEEKYFAKLMNF